ncbi:MAG: (d)CMP kinase [Flavobacteriales bacterium]
MSIQIAIDGHSSTGKSTIAKGLASHFGFLYVDSGAMYRCVALDALRMGLVDEDSIQTEAISKRVQNLDIQFDNQSILLNSEDVSTEIRSLKVASVVSRVSAIKAVRTALVSAQQNLAKAQSVVMDGRDIGSVVFPEAQIKLFVTAHPDVRAKRRFDELKTKGLEAELSEVKTNLLERDQTDSQRKESPLIQCEDAILIDNSNLSHEEQMEMIKALVCCRLG